MNVLLIIVQMLNAGIDYDLSRGYAQAASEKRKARDKVLDQLTSRWK